MFKWLINLLQPKIVHRYWNEDIIVIESYHKLSCQFCNKEGTRILNGHATYWVNFCERCMKKNSKISK